MTRFNQPSGGGSAAPRKAGGNVFSGLDPTAGGSKHPQFPFETANVCEILSTSRHQNTGDVVVTEVKVLESDSEAVKIGGTYAIVQPVGDKWGYGVARFCRMAIAAGNLTDAEADEMVAEARAGNGILNAAMGDADGVEKYGENPFKGLKVRVYVTRGKEDDKGGHYRDCQFSSVE